MTTNNRGRYDPRNKLNDLTGKEWLKLTKSFLFSERSSEDKDAFEHPAPFLVKDIEKFISMFTKKEMLVLDPFAGSGTTMLACLNLERKNISIDLNQKYKELARKRIEKKATVFNENLKYIVGDSLNILEKIENVDYIITSPPYHNILRNDGKGLRDYKKANQYRTGSRIGVEYYSDDENDLGNQESYEDFLKILKQIMSKAYRKLNNEKYCTIIMSDFTVDKKEKCVQGDIVKLMESIGFEFVGTIVLLQDNKPLFPFGYPYAFKINHVHQNVMNFRKNEI